MPRLRIKAKLIGVDRVRAKLRLHGHRITLLAANWLHEEAEFIKTAAQEETPVDTGALRSTEHVTGPVRQPRKLVVTISAGGPASGEHAGKYVGYAIPVHENLQARHRVGNAKYLERPFRAAQPGMAGRLAAHIKAAGY